jgi:AraC-like DNA-binding protein
VGRVIAHSVTAAPAPALRSLVAGYTGYHYEGFAPGVLRGLPGPHLTLVLPLDGPLRVTTPGGTAPVARSTAVGGLHARPALIHHDGTQIGVQLALAPLGARALLGLPAAALAGTIVGLDELLGPLAGELIGRLHDTPDWGRRFALIDAALLTAAARHERDRRRAPDEVVHAWRRLRAGGGNIGVAEVAGEVGWSRRHLSERFRDELGLPPKVFARVLRFERAQRQLRRPDRPALAVIAAEAGYYDQAHLTREFKELAGCPPGRWLVEEELIAVDAVDLDGGAA